jgi:UTP--glucose-1-phosphate uridylyltransferase
VLQTRLIVEKRRIDCRRFICRCAPEGRLNQRQSWMRIFDEKSADLDLLNAFQFDLNRWESQIDAIRQGHAFELAGSITSPIEPAGRIPELRFSDDADELDALRIGMAALSRGEVAILIVNGGMATRFGGSVKGTVEVLPGRSFLALRLEDVARTEKLWGRPIRVVLMNSFATRSATMEHLGEHGYFGLDPAHVLGMDQTISIRLDEDGLPFVGSDGRYRYYAPGHGEFFEVLLKSGLLARLASIGVRWLLFSNVDNVGATVEPRLIGLHIRSGVGMTVEVTEKRRDPTGRWDVGGAPVRVNGRLQVVEGFRFPRDFDQAAIPDFQTNNMIFSLDALSEPFRMPRYLVSKQVDGRHSIAFEAITCEASGVCQAEGTPRLSLGLVRVPRDGIRGRFFPVKSREDLDRIRPQLAERLECGWEIRAREANL